MSAGAWVPCTWSLVEPAGQRRAKGCHLLLLEPSHLLGESQRPRTLGAEAQLPGSTTACPLGIVTEWAQPRVRTGTLTPADSCWLPRPRAAWQGPMPRAGGQVVSDGSAVATVSLPGDLDALRPGLCGRLLLLGVQAPHVPLDPGLLGVGTDLLVLLGGEAVGRKDRGSPEARQGPGTPSLYEEVSVEGQGGTAPCMAPAASCHLCLCVSVSQPWE